MTNGKGFVPCLLSVSEDSLCSLLITEEECGGSTPTLALARRALGQMRHSVLPP